MTKILIGAVVYIVLTFALAYAWNMILFRETYVSLGSQSLRAEPIMPLGLVAILVEAFLLAVLFSKFSDGSIQQGLFLALAVGAFSVLYGAFVVPAKFMIEPIVNYAALELLFGVLHFGAAGLALAYVFRRA